MSFDPRIWTRYEFEQQPIYFRQDHPSWFAPNQAGEQLLQKSPEPCSAAQAKFFARLPDAEAKSYPGRYQYLNTDRLQELWFHVTNRCNLSCRHCLFSSGPAAADGELSADLILQRAAEAAELGCRIFALTGGEPLCHPEIGQILTGLLAIPDAHVVILSNGLLIEELLAGDYDLSRIHLQLSVDGLDERHDAIRGNGTFAKLQSQLRLLQQRQLPLPCRCASSVATYRIWRRWSILPPQSARPTCTISGISSRGAVTIAAMSQHRRSSPILLLRSSGLSSLGCRSIICPH